MWVFLIHRLVCGPPISPLRGEEWQQLYRETLFGRLECTLEVFDREKKLGFAMAAMAARVQFEMATGGYVARYLSASEVRRRPPWVVAGKGADARRPTSTSDGGHGRHVDSRPHHELSAEGHGGYRSARAPCGRHRQIGSPAPGKMSATQPKQFAASVERWCLRHGRSEGKLGAHMLCECVRLCLCA